LNVLILEGTVFVFNDFLPGGDFKVLEFFDVNVEVDWLFNFVKLLIWELLVLTVPLDLGSLNKRLY